MALIRDALPLMSELLNPFSMFTNRIQKPINFFLNSVFRRYRKKTQDGVLSAKNVLFKAGLVGLIASVVVWVAVFMYVVFYYTYMPNVMHSRPVHLQFQSCNEQRGVCSFPTAHIRLTKRQQFFMVGQPYKLILSLEMPNSETNKNLGMFMCCGELRTRSGSLVGTSCRSGLMPYQSFLLTVMKTFFYAPLLLPGLTDERSSVNLELFSGFEDDQNEPVTEVFLEVQSRHIELYSATLNIEAHFSGIRYMMYNWPVLSAALGISSNLMFIAIVCALSWYHLMPIEDEELLETSTDDKSAKESDINLFEDDELEGNIVVKKEPEDIMKKDLEELMEDKPIRSLTKEDLSVKE